jgi:hypothetical protein
VNEESRLSSSTFVNTYPSAIMLQRIEPGSESMQAKVLLSNRAFIVSRLRRDGRSRIALAAIVGATLTAATAATALAATASEGLSGLALQEQRQIQAQLGKASHVPVVVEVLPTTLSQMAQQGDAIVAQTRQLAEALLLELGDGALREGMHVSGNGLVTLYINQNGVDRLRESKRTLWFGPAREWHHRLPFTRDSAALQRVHEAVVQQGGAEIAVTLNLEGLSHSFAQDGSVTWGAVDPTVVRAMAGKLRQSVSHRPNGGASRALRAVERGEAR